MLEFDQRRKFVKFCRKEQSAFPDPGVPGSIGKFAIPGRQFP